MFIYTYDNFSDMVTGKAVVSEVEASDSLWTLLWTTLIIKKCLSKHGLTESVACNSLTQSWPFSLFFYTINDDPVILISMKSAYFWRGYSVGGVPWPEVSLPSREECQLYLLAMYCVISVIVAPVALPSALTLMLSSLNVTLYQLSASVSVLKMV